MIRDVRLDVRGVVSMSDRLSGQIPFATSVALNDLAKSAQAKQRGRMDDLFTIRRKQWAHRSVKIPQFSSKRNLVAIIGMIPPGANNKRDIWGKFEDGGTKRAKDGGRLAIPVDVRRGKTGVVGRTKRPKAFNFRLKGSGPKGTVYVGDKRTFMIRKADGTGGIYQRTSGGGGPRKGRRLVSDVATRNVRDLRIRILYRFTKEAHIDSRLHFEETVEGVVRASFASTFEAALERAIASGRTTNIGRHRGKDIIGANAGARRIARSDFFR